MRLFCTVCVLALFSGCGQGSNNDTGSEPNPNNPTQENDVPFGNIYADIAYDSQCDGFTDPDGNFTPVSGATVFWVGEFTFGGDQDLGVSGTESLRVLPNDEWKKNAPDDALDCTIIWNVTGTREYDAASCPSCDYVLTLHATKDKTSSTCSQIFTAGAYDDVMDESYNVYVNCVDPNVPCQASVSYNATDNPLGQGQSNKTALNYLSSQKCAFY